MWFKSKNNVSDPPSGKALQSIDQRLGKVTQLPKYIKSLGGWPRGFYKSHVAPLTATHIILAILVISYVSAVGWLLAKGGLNGSSNQGSKTTSSGPAKILSTSQGVGSKPSGSKTPSSNSNTLPGSPGSQQSSSAWWHVNGASIFDNDNQPVRLLGVDDGRMENSNTGSLSDFQQIKGWGFNTLRIAINWASLETTAPTGAPGNLSHSWNDTYLGQLDTVVQNAKSAGLKVILDMHQSSWSPVYGGHGFPSWMYPDSGEAEGTAKCHWLRNIADNGVPQNPQDGMVAVWQKVASRYANEPTVIGADIFNEPQTANCGSGFTYFPDGTSVTYVDNIYHKLGTAIRAVAPNMILFYEDDAYSGFSKQGWALTRPLDLPNSVYSWHFYPFTWDLADNQPGFTDTRPAKDKLADHLARANSWNVPIWIGEFDGFNLGNFDCSASATASSDLLAFMAYAKANNISWTFWEYKRQGSSIIDWRDQTSPPCPAPHTHTNQPKQPLLSDLQAGLEL